VVLPASSIHVVRLKGIPLEPGDLTIRGCFLRLLGSPVTEVPLAHQQGIKHLKSISVLRGAKLSEEESNVNTGTSMLHCEIAPSQPLLRIKRSSLAHGAVMLYDGET
jgi:trafficking protein particle complex subunit 9